MPKGNMPRRNMKDEPIPGTDDYYEKKYKKPIDLTPVKKSSASPKMQGKAVALKDLRAKFAANSGSNRSRG